MQGFSIDVNLIHFMMVVMVIMLVVQAYVLLRIRNILQAIAINFDSVIYFCRRFMNNKEDGAATAQSRQKAAKTCQFCKNRLAYINTSKAKENDESFYYRCGLRNINVSLNDSCVHFERDESSIREENDRDSSSQS